MGFQVKNAPHYMTSVVSTFGGLAVVESELLIPLVLLNHCSNYPCF